MTHNPLQVNELLTRNALLHTIVAVVQGFEDDVGASLRARREAKGLSQSAVAERFGIRLATISNIERGANVRLSSLVEYAKALGYESLAAAVLDQGGDDITRRMLRVWRALEDDEARRDALALVREQIGAEREPRATGGEGTGAAEQGPTRRRARPRR